MSEELKPCPACGHIPERHDWCSAPDGWSGHYFCTECYVAGPSVRGDREAMATAWNSLPRRLRWTKEGPSGDGCYLYRENDEIDLFLVKKTEDAELLIKNIVIGGFEAAEQKQGEWAGPIEEPQENK